MKFTWSWLNDFFETSLSFQEVGRQLGQLGFPVEATQDPIEDLRPFRVAEIIEVGRHPGADHLSLCQVKTAKGVLDIVCGGNNVRQGMKVVLALAGDRIPATGVVLKKGMIRGVESQGMMCSAGELGLEGLIICPEGGIIDLPHEAEVGTSLVDVLGDCLDPMCDIEVTPNRGDMLGVYGIARDLAAAGSGRLRPLDSLSPLSQGKQDQIQFQITPEAAAVCSSFILSRVTGIENKEAPLWMQRRMRAVGLKVISSVVDVTNYLAHTWARPLHAFDADLVQGAIALRLAKGGETFEGLDDVTYTLPAGALVICDEKGIISLAGILGGKRTACHVGTKNILLEGALFDAECIARTGQALNIVTDARSRFERGVDDAGVIDGLTRASYLTQELCGGHIEGLWYMHETPPNRHLVPFDEKRIQTLGGMTCSRDTALALLERLGFEIEGQSVVVPSWRHDVSREEDLVEEILRLEGYDTVPLCPLPFRPQPSPLNPLAKRVCQVSDILGAQGLFEVVTWSFIAQDKATLFASDGRVPLALENPISSALSTMRPSILPTLLDNAQMHLSHSLAFKGIFEIGPVYGEKPEDQETVVTCLLPLKGRAHWSKQEGEDVFAAKGILMRLFDALGVKEKSFVCYGNEGPAWFHPGRCATFKQGKKVLAKMGEMHPHILKAFELKQPFVGIELFLGRVPVAKKPFPKVPITLSSYQSITRDLAFVCDRGLAAAKLSRVILCAGEPLIQSIDVVDVFEDVGRLGADKKSLAVQMVFQSMAKTLTDADMDHTIRAILEAAKAQTGAVLRDV